jgi:hypothetical protein
VNRGCIVRVALKYPDVISVKSVEAGNRPEPHESLAILENAFHLAIGQAPLYVDTAELVLMWLRQHFISSPRNNQQTNKKANFPHLSLSQHPIYERTSKVGSNSKYE